jgi:hypothetical protein
VEVWATTTAATTRKSKPTETVGDGWVKPSSPTFYKGQWMSGIFHSINQNGGRGLALLVVLLAACQPVLPPKAAPQQAPFFRPPTLVSAGKTQTGQPIHAGDAGVPPPAVPCEDNLAFLDDLTIPDGTVVSPGSTLDKRWEVENSGGCNWGSHYRIRLIAGSEMSAQREQALYPARAGTRTVIRIQFKAPEEAGTYRSAWQAFNEQGEPFGDPFFIEIDVE